MAMKTKDLAKEPPAETKHAEPETDQAKGGPEPAAETKHAEPETDQAKGGPEPTAKTQDERERRLNAKELQLQEREKAAGGTAARFPDGARIEAGKSDHVLMRWKDPREEKISGGIATSTGRKYDKRPDGYYVIHREDVPDLRHHGLEVVG